MQTGRKIQSILYGPYGRANHSLIVLYANNGLKIFMLRRTANFTQSQDLLQQDQDIPIQVNNRVN